jgi:hypothetical protein
MTYGNFFDAFKFRGGEVIGRTLYRLKSSRPLLGRRGAVVEASSVVKIEKIARDFVTACKRQRDIFAELLSFWST